MLLRRLFVRGANSGPRVTAADRGDRALAACAADPPDCVLLDYRLPDIDGLGVLAALRARSDVPVVLLTGVGSEAVAVSAFSAKPVSIRTLVAAFAEVLAAFAPSGPSTL